MAKWAASEDAIAELAPDEFLDLFTKAFDIMTGKTDDGKRLTQRGFTRIDPTVVLTYIYTTVHNIMTHAHPEESAEQPPSDSTRAKRRRVAKADRVPGAMKGPTEPRPSLETNRMFAWSNGALRPFPETWLFPKYWFCGDKAAKVGPFRLFGTAFFPQSHGRTHFVSASIVMAKLIGITIDTKWVGSEGDIARLAVPDLMILFAKSFVVLMRKLAKSRPGLEKLAIQQLAVSTVATMIKTGQH
ncbi:Aste57867_7341 [Aphanomyces stellatus]|uniref:Aste57867_6258 protein n=1 Tax=Aphanomyces stellatus TaxID=120398 RepID=A0A485KI61_9STRA|nr:hypothetical protein As57867_007315 [Aphanomyces stellatus]KAF0705515.1 hypothetical protein As57867_007004 [Aphanomyces stellatus]KAF0708682.1 hypothetical protein As57867_006244 [Aphanomyces stellatus]VFT83257.1 Aste57867_6258 [Aphanomyces stellatus]VFT83976.1 Aste57867_7027 [Aphanomyces stellatus]